MSVSPTAFWPLRTAWILVISAACTFVATAMAMETWKLDDRTYHNVRVSTVTDATVTIFHKGGISQLKLEELPPELQQRFGYDPGKAAQWQETARQGREETLKLQRDALKTLKKIAEANRALASSETGNTSEPGFEETHFEILPKVDLRPLYHQHGLVFKDQGRRPSCSIFALVSALEYEYARTYGRADSLSEEFLIWAVRELQPGIPIDDGYHFAEVVSALQTYGIARQSVMPNTFGVKLSEIEPDVDAMADALPRRNAIPVWLRANDPYLVARVIDALNKQTPVVIGIRWPHWRTLLNNHLLRDQQPIKGNAHAVTIVGYESPDQTLENTKFIFRNSYGVNWGLGGCGFITANYLHHHTLSAFHLTLPGTSPNPAQLTTNAGTAPR